MIKDLVAGNIEKISELEAKIKYTFKDKDILLMALTHSSYANEKKHGGLESNERLEFLGDAVLNIITSEYIYGHYPGLSEGEMTKTRASIVCEASLVKCARSIMLGDYLLLGKGEENSGGRNRTSILSDAFEALIGAIYLDGGLKEAANFLFSVMNDILRDFRENAAFVDYKTQFQELVQKHGEQSISYKVISETGPDHNKKYAVQVSVGNNVLGTGEGHSKKEAEQNAARIALEKLRGASEKLL
ncbi:MAG: ribonuclease III [Bacillota bacterium]